MTELAEYLKCIYYEKAENLKAHTIKINTMNVCSLMIRWKIEGMSIWPWAEMSILCLLIQDIHFHSKSWNERVSSLLQQLCVEHVWQTELLSSDDRSSTESQPNVSSQLPAIIDSNQLSPGLTARLRILLWHLHRHLATKTKRISGRKEYLIRIYWTLLASWLQRRIQLVEESK